MRSHYKLFCASALSLALLAVATCSPVALAGIPKPAYQVLEPMTQDNLTIFPVVTAATHDTSSFLTLDEGLSSGQVIVTEAGRAQTALQRPHGIPAVGDGAEVNRLVLINKSDRPLLLLAGEIVTGGKQDRIVGKDRIVPRQSEPVDLSVFCVEPGRWVATGSKFGALSLQMAQPSVRRGAMAERSQIRVWDEVRNSQSAVSGNVAGAPGPSETTSYAKVMKHSQVQSEVDKVAQPIEQSYDRLIGELRDRKAVGVVVAVNGRFIWADVFASTSLLEKYWPKLVRSYAAEAIVARTGAPQQSKPRLVSAQQFLGDAGGNREIVQTEPGVFRESEIQAEKYKVFELVSLLPGTNYLMHMAKMVTGSPEESHHSQSQQPTGIIRQHVQW